MRRELWIYAVLGLLTLAVYWPATHADFINYDDPDYVTDDYPVLAGLTKDSVVWAFTTSHSSNWHPLTWLSHMADCQLFGLNAGRHHLVNILFHTANSLLLFALLQILTGARWRSAIVAALFAWHPLHVESVAWISERKDVLSTFFWFLTLLAYTAYARASGRAPGKASLYYGLALLAFALGLMAKPMLVTLPFVLLLLDYWPLARADWPGAVEARRNSGGAATETWPRLLLEKLPFFALTAASSVVTFIVQRTAGSVIPLQALPFWARSLNALVSYGRYLRKMIWPADLSVFYPLTGSGMLWRLLAAVAVLAAISVMALRLRRSHRYVIVGWLWYLGTLVPVIGLVQVGFQSLADRYTYVPLVGIFIILAWGAVDLSARRPRLLTAAKCAVAVALAACLVLTWFQVRAWHDSISLYRHCLAVTTRNAAVQNLLGMALNRQKRYADAEIELRKAIEWQPEFAEAHNSLAHALLEQGQTNGAIRELRQAIELDPENADVQNEAGTVLLENGQVDEAAGHFRAAIKLNPRFAKPYNNLGLALSQQGRPDEAVASFEQAIAIHPNYSQAHNNLGFLLIQIGKADEAIPHFRAALASQPDFADALNNLGLALFKQGRLNDAAAQFQKSLAVNPADDLAQNNVERMAWLLATSPESPPGNGARAVELALLADQAVHGNNARFAATLAAAYAGAGKFPEAVSNIDRAIRLAQSETNSRQAGEFQAQRQLYLAEKPYHAQ